VLKKWVKQAGFTKRLHYHLARHTFATLIIMHGGDLYTTSKLLGHTSLNSTQIYAHVVGKPKLEAMQRISEATRQHREKTGGKAA